ncbi:MAG TPA: porin [Burkholderiaceae bacterium]|jgi:predicted porin|nr:porin [Burkholderiaceae bacterium]
MHKTVIALAIAAMAAAPAFADSNVTLYGSIDYGYGIRSGDNTLAKNCTTTPGPGCSKQEFISGTDVYNRLGFKGSEDLGNGTKVIFEIEMGFLADTGENSIPNTGNESNGLFRNHSWVGLTGEWGTVVGGRVDGSRYSVTGRYDPFNNGTVAAPGSLNGQAQRADNAIAYITPNYEGLYAVIAYTSQLTGQENPYNNGDVRLYVLPQLNYVNGPISATLNYEHVNVHNSPVNAKINIYVIGASYDFGVAKIMGLWEKVKTDTNAGTPTSGVLADENTWFIGGIVPLSENDKLRAVYTSYKDRSAAANSCSKWGVGGEHYLSKRTNLYLDFASITEKDNGGCTISYNAQSNGDATNPATGGTGGGGVGTRGLDMGIVHRF